MTVTTKTKLKTKKTVQKFVRINIDTKLDKILAEYNQEYPLFSNAEIIKMLISKGIRQNQKQRFKQILQGQSFVDVGGEQDQFDWLRKNNFMK